MQVMAMVSMLIDHIGYMFFPDEVMWRVIGRIAFPLYAFSIILGYRHTSNLKKYVIRLFILALIAQIPFMLAFKQLQLNVIFTLLISLVVVILLDKHRNIVLQAVILAASMLFMELIPMDYGAYGLLLVVIYRYSQSYWCVSLHLCLNLLYLLYGGSAIQMMSLISTLMIVMLPNMIIDVHRSTPAWLWRSFYPVHLCILALIAYAVH